MLTPPHLQYGFGARLFILKEKKSVKPKKFSLHKQKIKVLKHVVELLGKFRNYSKS